LPSSTAIWWILPSPCPRAPFSRAACLPLEPNTSTASCDLMATTSCVPRSATGGGIPCGYGFAPHAADSTAHATAHATAHTDRPATTQAITPTCRLHVCLQATIISHPHVLKMERLQCMRPNLQHGHHVVRVCPRTNALFEASYVCSLYDVRWDVSAAAAVTIQPDTTAGVLASILPNAGVCA